MDANDKDKQTDDGNEENDGGSEKVLRPPVKRKTGSNNLKGVTGDLSKTDKDND